MRSSALRGAVPEEEGRGHGAVLSLLSTAVDHSLAKCCQDYLQWLAWSTTAALLL